MLAKTPHLRVGPHLGRQGLVRSVGAASSRSDQGTSCAVTVSCVTGGGSIRCVGAVVQDDAGRLLLVRRVNEPGRGRWSLPGGRIEVGENDRQALVREVAEETGLDVEIFGEVGSVQLPAPDGAVFDIHDYFCRLTGGVLRAGDDADEVRWCDGADLAALPVVDGLLEALAEWNCLPR